MAIFAAKLGSPNPVIAARSWQRNFTPLGQISRRPCDSCSGGFDLLAGALGQEGAESARIAKNLRSGLGYVGIGTPGSDLMMSPLYPHPAKQEPASRALEGVRRSTTYVEYGSSMEGRMSLTESVVREAELLATSRRLPKAENSHVGVAGAESNSKERQ
jgi:hypothetical protein